jgi:hypothetical protein
MAQGMRTSGVDYARGYWRELVNRSRDNAYGVWCDAEGIAAALSCPVECVGFVAELDTHRESESNFMVAVDMLNVADPTREAFTVQRFSHSLVGWIDHVFVDTRNAAVCEVVNRISDALAAYPVLNEHHWCEHEWQRDHPEPGVCYSDAGDDCPCRESRA